MATDEQTRIATLVCGVLYQLGDGVPLPQVTVHDYGITLDWRRQWFQACVRLHDVWYWSAHHSITDRIYGCDLPETRVLPASVVATMRHLLVEA